MNIYDTTLVKISGENTGVENFLKLGRSNLIPTLGARALHAPHPDRWLKAGKTSRHHEVNGVSKVLVTNDLWFQLSFLELKLTLELSMGVSQSF